ncbi:unnamed protein product [Knipowitschia caucasica]
MEQLHSDIGAMRCALQLQGEVCADLRVITADVNRRVCSLECTGEETQKSEVLCRRDLRVGQACVTEVALTGGRDNIGSALVNRSGGSSSEAAPVTTETTSGSLSAVRVDGSDYAHSSGGSDEANADGGTTQLPGSPKWSTVLKRGKPHPGGKTGTRHTSVPGLRKPGKSVVIVGTGAAGHQINTVTTKLVSVFASKFSPDLDVKTLSDYLQEQLDREVMCQKIATANSRFSSFKVTAECNEVAEMYKPEIWPVGAYVRRFYEPRSGRAGVSGSNGGTLGGLKSGALSANVTETD